MNTHCITGRCLALLVFAALAGTASAAEDCDRGCLVGIADEYLSALATQDPTEAPVAPTVRFTENTHLTKLGQGSAWTNITGVQDYRIYVADPDAGQVALYTVIDGKKSPAILTLRMKVADKLITEIESVYVDIAQSGMASLDNLKTAAPIWKEEVPEAKRRTREEMIAITDKYFTTLEDHVKDIIPFTDDCLRVENGVMTAGNPKGTGIGAMSCKDNLNQPIWAYITHVQPRRYLVVDVERGLVSGMFMFRHSGEQTSYVNDKGETVPFSAAMLKKQAVVISELFKIEDGKIRRIEAVMSGNLPLDAPSGWEP
jgi:hypothetical protein